MSFALPAPSLQERSLAALAVALWKQDDYGFVLSCIQTAVKEKLQNVFDIVLERARKLPLPEKLKVELSRYVDAAGWQIFKMKEYLKDQRFVELDKLCWTAQCTVDRRKTSELLIKEANLGIYGLYKLACTNCLEDYIPLLWEQLEEFMKDLGFMKRHTPPLLSFWSHYIKGEIAQLNDMMKNHFLDPAITPNEYAFRYSAMTGEEAATKYFFRKLTPREKERKLLETVTHVACCRLFSLLDGDRAAFPVDKNYSDVLCFLLSNMDKEQQTEVLKAIPLDVLVCLLDWPWQSLLVETVQSMSDFIPEECFHDLLQKVVKKVVLRFKDWNYQKLFEELWLQIPLAHKKYVIGKCASCGSLLLDLIGTEDEENIKLILKDATAEEKEKILCSLVDKIAYVRDFDNWDMLKFFFNECMLSKDKMIEVTEVFRKVEWYAFNEDSVMVKLERFKRKVLKALDDVIDKSDGKRSIEGGSTGPAKRIYLMGSAVGTITGAKSSNS